jgi:hypothetical protein
MSLSATVLLESKTQSSEASRPTFCLIIIECIDIAELERSNDLLGDRLATI